MNWIRKWWAWLTDNNSFECISNILDIDYSGRPVCAEIYKHKTQNWEIKKVFKL